jgi:hypothetical protein
MADTVNASIVEHFRTLEDPRLERTKKHLLLDILAIALCTLLSGATVLVVKGAFIFFSFGPPEPSRRSDASAWH